MDVVVANAHKDDLYDLDIDIIKMISGVYSAVEVGEMFSNFFFDRMIIDVTALKDNDDYHTYQKLVTYLDPDKIVFLLPEGSKMCTPNFLGYLISDGIYNFTTNINGVSFLLGKPNTFKEVEHIAKMSSTFKKSKVNEKEKTPKVQESTDANTVSEVRSEPIKKHPVIIGVRNITASAGATTLIYMMFKELALAYGRENVLAMEIDKKDFSFFYEKGMVSVDKSELDNALEKYSDKKILLVDLNDCLQESFCSDIIYLIEPSTLKLNRLVQRNKNIFQALSGKKVVLNQSILQNNDIFDFEGEAGIKVFYNIPPLDERKRNSVIASLLSRIGLLSNNQESASSGKIFGLFRR